MIITSASGNGSVNTDDLIGVDAMAGAFLRQRDIIDEFTQVRSEFGMAAINHAIFEDNTLGLYKMTIEEVVQLIKFGLEPNIVQVLCREVASRGGISFEPTSFDVQKFIKKLDEIESKHYSQFSRDFDVIKESGGLLYLAGGAPLSIVTGSFVVDLDFFPVMRPSPEMNESEKTASSRIMGVIDKVVASLTDGYAIVEYNHDPVKTCVTQDRCHCNSDDDSCDDCSDVSSEDNQPRKPSTLKDIGVIKKSPLAVTVTDSSLDLNLGVFAIHQFIRRCFFSAAEILFSFDIPQCQIIMQQDGTLLVTELFIASMINRLIYCDAGYSSNTYLSRIHKYMNKCAGFSVIPHGLKSYIPMSGATVRRHMKVALDLYYNIMTRSNIDELTDYLSIENFSRKDAKRLIKIYEESDIHYNYGIDRIFTPHVQRFMNQLSDKFISISCYDGLYLDLVGQTRNSYYDVENIRSKGCLQTSYDTEIYMGGILRGGIPQLENSLSHQDWCGKNATLDLSGYKTFHRM